MRRLPYILVGIVVLLIAGYSVFWYMQAQRAKALFVDIAANLPEQTAKTGKEFTLKYDDISVGGYPLRYRVIFKNPMLSWRETTTGNITPFKEEIKGVQLPLDSMKINGELAVEGDYIASSFSASATGTVDGNMNTSAGPLSWQSHWDGENTFSIDLNEEGRKRILSGENPFGLLQDPQAMVRSLRGLSAHSENFSVKRIPDGKQIFFVPLSDIRFSIEPLNETNAEVTMKADVDDMVMTKEYAQLMSGFAMMAATKNSQPAPAFHQFDERAGKTSMKIDLHATGPFLVQGPPKQEYDLNVESREFSIKNDWLEVTLPMMFKASKSKDGSSFNLTHNGVIRFSKEMEQALHDDYITSGRAYGEISRLFEEQGQSAPPADTIDVEGVFPAISTLGEIKTTAEAASSDNGKKVEIKKVAIHSDLYSLDAAGEINVPENVASVKMDCTNCLQLVDDATSYYNRVKTFMQQVNPNAQGPLLTATQIEAIKQMLVQLDADPATSDVITFDYKQQGQTSTISGKPLQQVMLQAVMILAVPSAGPVGEPVPSTPEKAPAKP